VRPSAPETHECTRVRDAGMDGFVRQAKCATERCRYHHEIDVPGSSFSGLDAYTTRQSLQLRSANRANKSGPKRNMHRSVRI